MAQPDFYEDLKYCPKCDKYVQYLLGPQHSYCVECEGTVRMFSQEDWVEFVHNIPKGRPRGTVGRPRKIAESA